MSLPGTFTGDLFPLGGAIGIAQGRTILQLLPSASVLQHCAQKRKVDRLQNIHGRGCFVCVFKHGLKIKRAGEVGQ